MATCSKRRVTEEDPEKDALKKSRVDDSKAENADGQAEPQVSIPDEAKTGDGGETKEELKEFIIGKTEQVILLCSVHRGGV